MTRCTLLLLSLLLFTVAYGQGGLITGEVRNTHGNTIMYGNVFLLENNKIVDSSKIYIDGVYLFKNIKRGEYRLLCRVFQHDCNLSQTLILDSVLVHDFAVEYHEKKPGYDLVRTSFEKNMSNLHSSKDGSRILGAMIDNGNKPVRGTVKIYTAGKRIKKIIVKDTFSIAVEPYDAYEFRFYPKKFRHEDYYYPKIFISDVNTDSGKITSLYYPLFKERYVSPDAFKVIVTY